MTDYRTLCIPSLPVPHTRADALPLLLYVFHILESVWQRKSYSFWQQKSHQSSKHRAEPKYIKRNLLAKSCLVRKIDSSPGSQDAPHPGHGAAGPYHGGPDGGGVQLCCEDVDNVECSRSTELSNKNYNIIALLMTGPIILMVFVFEWLSS